MEDEGVRLWEKRSDNFVNLAKVNDFMKKLITENGTKRTLWYSGHFL